MKIKLDDKITVMIILALIALFSFIFLGFSGFKVIFGMVLVFFLPFYLIMDNFEISVGEKVMFSFFIGLGIFPAIVYWVGALIPFKIAVLATFLILISVGLVIRRMKKPKNTA